MDWNTNRYEDGADQLRTPADQSRSTVDQSRSSVDQSRSDADQPRAYPDHRRAHSDAPPLYADDAGTYPGEDEPYPDQPETYWRRRAVTLAAGLGVIALLAWAFSGGGGKPAPAPSNSPAAASYPTAPTSVPASAAPSAGADAAVPGLANQDPASQGTSGLPSATTSPSAKSSRARASASASAARSGTAQATAKTGTAQATAKAGATPDRKPGGRCSPSSVVLSLFSSSRSFRLGQDPQFDVNAVSTAPGTCTFDVSPGQLSLVVMSAGRVIWDSADCARGAGTELSKLTRGIPVQEYFTWNRAITLPGCVVLASSARPGSYQAQARTPAVSSGTFAFKLTR
jgi:hypothetical protein